MGNYLIYGANGYTAALTAREAVARGQRPVLAGRNAQAVAALARELGLEHRIFSLDDPAAIRVGLAGMTVVLHCAGPFAHTAKAMAEACLDTGVHYLDITGEIGVFEALYALDARARAAGVMLLPGAGFDVVPSDCLAAHLKRRLPTATKLALGFQGLGRVSRGTATTMTENLHRGGAVRRGGILTPVPAAWRTRTIDFGRGPIRAITIPWGDVSTAYRSTGIPDIEVYLAAPLSARILATAMRVFGKAMAAPAVQRFLKRRIQAGPPGPTDEERRRGMTLLWGELKDDAGKCAVSRLRGPEGYTMTVLTSLAVVARVLSGQAPPGFQTPSLAYGADLVLEIPGVVRTDDH
jgi:short subunit dehydrogenase-like uncharacterized protein